MDLAEFIKVGRKKQGITVKDLINKAELKITPSLFSQWESGKKLPGPGQLEKICEALNLEKWKAFQYWAQFHMPNPKLKGYFTVREREPQPVIDQVFDPQSFFPLESTCVLNERDIDFFEKNPQAIDIILASFEAFYVTKKTISVAQLSNRVSKTLQQTKRLVENLAKRKYLILQGGHICPLPQHEYFFINESRAFAKVRMAYLQYRLSLTMGKDLKNLKNSKSSVFILQNSISEKRVKICINEMKRLSFKFIADMEKGQKNRKLYQWINICVPYFEN